MVRRVCRAFATSLGLALAVIPTGCGGGSSPTEPEKEYSVLAVGMVSHSSYQYTMRRVQLLIDNEVIRDYSSNSSFYDVIVSGTAYLDRGAHRLEVRVQEQTSSPNSYRVSASITVFDSSGREVRDINFPERTVTLSSGQGVSYTFSI